MPLDTSSTYGQTLLRTDGRRWNERRHVTASMSTQASSDGSSQFVMGNTVVVCTVVGPREGRGSSSSSSVSPTHAIIETEVTIAPFAQTERRRRTKTMLGGSSSNDRRSQELQTTISSAFQTHLFTHLYPRSSISICLHVLSLDGGLLATCLNAASLALVDAGVPMPSILAAVTSGVITYDNASTAAAAATAADPILDLTNTEEQELPFLSVATVSGLSGPIGHQDQDQDQDPDPDPDRRGKGEEDKVSVLVMESSSHVQMSPQQRRRGGREGGRGREGGGNNNNNNNNTTNKIESMLAVGIDGCKQIRTVMEDVVRSHGARILKGRK